MLVLVLLDVSVVYTAGKSLMKCFFIWITSWSSSRFLGKLLYLVVFHRVRSLGRFCFCTCSLHQTDRP